MGKIARNLMAKKSNDRGMITDAKDVLSIVARLRGAIARGDIGEACCDGMALGRFSERLRLRIHGFDGYVRQVKTNTHKLQDGFVEAGLAHDKNNIESALILYSEMLKKYPGQKGVAQKKVREQTGIAERTLRDYLKKSLADL